MSAVDAVFAMWRQQLVDSGFRQGCPVLAVAVEHDDGAERLQSSAGDIFDRWRDALAAALSAHAIAGVRARRLAGLVIASVAGAVVICRAVGSTVPLDDAAREIHDLLAEAVAGALG